MKRLHSKLMLLGLLSLVPLASCASVETSSSVSSSEAQSSTGTSSSTHEGPGGPGGPGENGEGPGGGNGGGGSSSSVTYKGATEITSATSVEGSSYSSDTADENALLLTGSFEASLKSISVSKSGDSDGGDTASFYGNNSALLAKGGAKVTIEGATIESTAKGGNGVFSYGGYANTNNTSTDGTSITISESQVTTTKDNAGGIMVTGGGILNAKDLTVTTSGVSSAAIRSDRGGGTLTVNGGTYTTNGAGSPAVYSTATVSVKNATLTSNAAEGAVIEGKHSIRFENVSLTDSNTKLNGKSTTYKNVFLYQSVSGDSASGTSTFEAVDSSFVTKKGDSFYITNNSASITLENCVIANSDADGYFLRAKADSWGEAGSNGGEVTLSLINQTVEGDIAIDSVSTLDMSLKEGSSFVGAINASKEAKSLAVTLDKGSAWTLTGDSYVTSLTNADSTNSNINLNGHTLYVNGVVLG